MSYILDALKKSEQERMRGATPTLHAIHAEPFRQARLIGWHYLLIAAALAVSAVAVWQRPWQADSTRQTDTPKVAFLPAPPPRPEPQLLLAAAAPSQPTVVAHRETPVAVMPKPALRREKPQTAEAEPAKAHKTTARTEPPAIAAAAPPEAAPPPRPPLETVARTTARQEIIDISELPAAVQRSLPKLAISGYVTHPDDPAGKMVGIGSQILGEGDEVSPGLKLEKIADTAAVFAYKGYRFRISLP